MTWDNRIIWSEGTFLQPQHFQQHDRHVEAQLELRTRALRPYPWGFLELAVDESLLELGKLGVRSARGVLPDGTSFDCPARDPLPPPLGVPASYTGLGVARVVERRADNRVVLDTNGYVPPMLDVGAASALASLLRDVHGLLHQRGDALAARMSQPGPGGVGEIAEFLWLEVMNRFEPIFAHLAATVPLHPERLYEVCLSLAGELSTFTRETRRPVAYPIYRHDDLAGSFGPVIADIRRSLSMVLERNAISIELQERAYGLRVASIPDSDLIKTARFVLAAKAQLQPERLQASLPTLIKIGPVERIRDLVNLNLPGIALRSLPVAPRQIPYHAGFIYFELDRGADLWKVTEQSRALAMHIAGEFPGLELEFWAVRGA